MKLKDGRITFLVGHDSTTIELIDNEANTTFARVTLTPGQLSQALSRLAYTECEIDIRGLKKVGKKRISERLEFPLTGHDYGKDRKEKAIAEAKRLCPVGWTPSLHFGSQTSFFNKGGEAWARTTILKWIDLNDVGQRD